jgi:hypothetical protein
MYWGVGRKEGGEMIFRKKMPIIFSGVLISCDIVAKKCDFASLAAAVLMKSASFASSRRASVRSCRNI